MSPRPSTQDFASFYMPAIGQRRPLQILTEARETSEGGRMGQSKQDQVNQACFSQMTNWGKVCHNCLLVKGWSFRNDVSICFARTPGASKPFSLCKLIRRLCSQVPTGRGADRNSQQLWLIALNVSCLHSIDSAWHQPKSACFLTVRFRFWRCHPRHQCAP